ncbi:NAD(P)H-dependent oxidoreductase [Microvirga sp. 2YAF29]|uniref:NAD(P)H-dependent oxidoreductase n=1 Tax=Microvirga sp. 2YAF29 TaxID=3233031 RepID=UPI003F9D1CBE
MPKLVAIAGSPSPDFRTRSLVTDVLERMAQETGGSTILIDVAELVQSLAVRTRDEVSPQLAHSLRLMEEVDLLVVGSPVYKGSYTGFFKHFMDLVDYKALAGVPVALLALGGSDRHALVIDHQLRPLFSFFNAHTLPTGVFVSDSAFTDGHIADPAIRKRLSILVHEGAEALRLRASTRSLRAA